MAEEKAFRSWTDVGADELNMERTEFTNKFDPKLHEYLVKVGFVDIVGNNYFQEFVTEKENVDGFKLVKWSLPVGFEKVKMITVDLA